MTATTKTLRRKIDKFLGHLSIPAKVNESLLPSTSRVVNLDRMQILLLMIQVWYTTNNLQLAEFQYHQFECQCLFKLLIGECKYLLLRYLSGAKNGGLHYVAYHGHEKTAMQMLHSLTVEQKLLIINLRNKHSHTAFDIAAARGNHNILKILEHHAPVPKFHLGLRGVEASASDKLTEPQSLDSADFDVNTQTKNESTFREGYAEVIVALAVFVVIQELLLDNLPPKIGALPPIEQLLNPDDLQEHHHSIKVTDNCSTYSLTSLKKTIYLQMLDESQKLVDQLKYIRSEP